MFHLLLYLTAVLHLSTCGSMELCQGDSKCILCTVTGPSVVDVHGIVNSVEDRCGYTLMKTSSIPDLQVRATFQERRRTDVSFVDTVILSLDTLGVQINLEQGGRVKQGNTVMNFNTTTVHGVELSKNQTGVTAKMSHSNYTMSVFFDGYTAQIHIKGPSGQVPFVEGLCGNSSISEARLSDNADICETKYEGTNDTTINCSKSTERCNLLPSIACHINPEPYVTACTNTLCKYPAVDGLNCQFLEAYARACSLYNNDTQDGWRSMANCPATPQAFCQDRFCSAHEFCGDDILKGGIRCHCRAIFASPYRSENTLGDPVVCNDTAKLATLVGCLLEDKGINYTDLHLYDKTCKAQMDDVTHMVTIGFDTKTNPCGAMIRMNDENQTINKNGVILESTGEELMDFTCPFVIPEITIDFSMNIKVKEGSNSTSVAYVTFGNWTYTLTMKAFTDSRRTQPVDSNTLLHLNQMVWFELKADIITYEKVVLVTQSCYATNEPSANSSLRYNLIVNGCPSSADQTVIIESNGESASNYFSFRMFRFTGKNANIYLHCNLSLCLNENNSCIPNCSQEKRRRRSAMYEHEDINEALLVMAWST